MDDGAEISAFPIPRAHISSHPHLKYCLPIGSTQARFDSGFNETCMHVDRCRQSPARRYIFIFYYMQPYLCISQRSWRSQQSCLIIGSDTLCALSHLIFPADTCIYIIDDKRSWYACRSDVICIREIRPQRREVVVVKPLTKGYLKYLDFVAALAIGMKKSQSYRLSSDPSNWVSPQPISFGEGASNVINFGGLRNCESEEVLAKKSETLDLTRKHTSANLYV